MGLSLFVSLPYIKPTLDLDNLNGCLFFFLEGQEKMLTKVKLERIQRGLRQTDVAALTQGEVPQYRLSLIERGVTPLPNEAKALADVFKVEVEELFQTS
jgi:DNA-binding XRE family transcriptional regulator